MSYRAHTDTGDKTVVSSKAHTGTGDNAVVSCLFDSVLTVWCSFSRSGLSYFLCNVNT